MKRSTPIWVLPLILVVGGACVNPMVLLDDDRYSIDSRLFRVLPEYPFPGRPILATVPEEDELEKARANWRLVERCVERSVGKDEARFFINGQIKRLDDIHDIFDRLTAVSHRPENFWKLYVVGSGDQSLDLCVPGWAFALGGGVVVLSSSFLRRWRLDEEDESMLAAVLAHEIAHVTLRHAVIKQSWTDLGAGSTGWWVDHRFGGTFLSQSWEADADRVAALYLALAGFDPTAAQAIWEAEADYDELAEQRGWYLTAHPAGPDRVEIARLYGERAKQYLVLGQRNLDWQELLKRNAVLDDPPPARKEAALLEALLRRQVRSEQDYFSRAAKAQSLLRVITVDRTDESVNVTLENITSRSIAAVRLALGFFRDEVLERIDTSCSARVAIQPGSRADVSCGAPSASTDVVAVVSDVMQVAEGSPKARASEPRP